MPRVADYSAIRDGGFPLSTSVGDDIDWDDDFNLPAGVAPSKSIVAFVVDPETDIDDLRLRVRINDVNVRNPYLFNAGGRRTIHEIVRTRKKPGGPPLLNAGSNNIEFKIVSGSGTVHISDVVLWWQHDIS